MRTRRVAGPPVYRLCFPRRYTTADIALLPTVDSAHDTPAGPAVRHILQRKYRVFGKPEYARLAGISVSHIYNLRRSQLYRSHRVTLHHRRARPVSIAERRKPDPRGLPGYLRVDTVHQGNADGQRGVYHLNAVDSVTQWQVVGCLQTISARISLLAFRSASVYHQRPILGVNPGSANRTDGFETCDLGRSGEERLPPNIKRHPPALRRPAGITRSDPSWAAGAARSLNYGWDTLRPERAHAPRSVARKVSHQVHVGLRN